MLLDSPAFHKSSQHPNILHPNVQSVYRYRLLINALLVLIKNLEPAITFCV